MRTLLAGLGGGTGALAAAGVAFALIAAGFWIQSNRRTDEVPQPVVAVVPAPQENKVKPAPTEAVQTPDVSDAEEGAAQPVEEASATVAPAPEESAAEAEDTIAEAASPEPAIPSPIFEEIRREPDGVTVIAGQGAPGAQISVLQDGVEIAKAVADDAGCLPIGPFFPDGGNRSYPQATGE